MRSRSRVYTMFAATLAIGVGVPLRPTVVQGHSMEPTMRAGLYILNTGYYRVHPLQKGDVIVEIAGQSIANIYDYMYALDALKIGQPAKVIYTRAGQRREATLIPAARK